MKKYYFLFTIFLFILETNGQNVWNQKADFAGGDRQDAVGFSIGNFGFIGTGSDSNGLRKDFWKWDQNSNAWTQIADFGGSARAGAVGFSINGKGYVGTGAGTDDFWEYDPIIDVWIQKADFGGTARTAAVGFSINGKGYLGTGIDTSGPRFDFWEYDPTIDLWTQKAGFQGGVRYGATGVALGNKGYVGIGSPDFIPVNDFWEYDPITDDWTQKANFPGPARAWAVGFSVGSKIYIGTGLDVMPPPYGADDIWEYDILNDTWVQVASFPDSEVHNSVGFSINTKGYIGTGNVSIDYENFFWEYSPTVGFDEHANLNYSIYPNPFSTSAEIITNHNFKNATFSIYDVLGKEIRQISNITGQQIHIERQSLANGVYVLLIKEKNDVVFAEKVFVID